ncbi:LPS assembly protein LptD [Psychrobacter aestuarii]
MLYSPLYQSIRLILFGALGLTVSTAGAAVTMTGDALSIDENTVITRSNAAMPVAPSTTNTFRPADWATAYDASVTRALVTGTPKRAAANTAPVADDTATAAQDTPATDTALTDDSTMNAAPRANSAERMPTQRTIPALEASRAERSIATDPALDNSRLDVSDESIQESLTRLAEFYKLKPKSDTTPAAATSDNDDSNDLQAEDATPITPVGRDLQPFSRDDDTDDDINTANSSQRCEGQWVYPAANSNYQRSAAEQGRPVQPGMPNNQAPLYAESDYGYYDNVDYAELSGNVVVNQGTQQIKADSIVLDLTSGVAGAQGEVMFTDSALDARAAANDKRTPAEGGLIGVADSLAYSTETGQSTAYGVAFASVPMQAHGYAKRLNRPNETEYELDEVMFSTCPPTNRKWQLDAKSIDIDTDTGRGIARDTTFRIADVPVFYLPYFNFPIDNRRSSGFLLPSASIGSESGFELDVPYYLNLAPNYDATLNTHLYTNRNPMLSGEFRYLSENYGEGIINGSYLPNDREYDGEDRSSLFYDHHWESKTIPRLSGDAKYSYVSDADYLNDFDTLGLSDNTLNLPRRAQLNYYNDYVNGELKVETFQTLQAFTDSNTVLQDKDKPYSRLPQLQLDYRLPWFDNIDVTGVHDSAYFKKSIDDGSEAEKSGVRIYDKISASYPFERAWGYVKPKVSLQHLYTSYDQDSLEDNNLSDTDGSRSVFVPQASIDAGLNYYKAGSPFGAFDDSLGGYQILSPRFKYIYSPYEEQDGIPNFNTRIASINYAQLYSDSWFLGHDRLQDLHAFTPGVNYRYIDATGVTRFDGSIAEQFYLDDGRVTLEDEQPVFNSSSSGVVWDASTQPYNNFWVDVSGALDNSYDLNYVTTALRYQPSADSLFNVGYVERKRDENTNQLPLSAVTSSAIFPVNDNWRFLAQGQYDFRSDKMLDALVGVDYEDCCFGFAVYGRRYYNDLNLTDKPTQAVMAEIRLNGIGSNSSRLTRLLSDKIQGFEPVQNAWKD